MSEENVIVTTDNTEGLTGTLDTSVQPENLLEYEGEPGSALEKLHAYVSEAISNGHALDHQQVLALAVAAQQEGSKGRKKKTSTSEG